MSEKEKTRKAVQYLESLCMQLFCSRISINLMTKYIVYESYFEYVGITGLNLVNIVDLVFGTASLRLHHSV